jgi:hypothetical protein
MQAAAKFSITIPADRRVELKLPEDLPAGPAEVIILAPLRSVPADRLSVDEDQLDAAAQAAAGQDPRFKLEGELLIFAGEIDPELEDELDHRSDREQRLDRLGHGGP